MGKRNFKGKVCFADLRKFIQLSGIKYSKNFNNAVVNVTPNISFKVFI